MSVVNEHEVFIVKDFADIIDLKNPEDGPLGCLKINDIKNIVNRFSQKLVFSATLILGSPGSSLKSPIVIILGLL